MDRRLVVLVCVGLASGCGNTRKNLIYENTVPLPSGRFVGPVELEVPRQADHRGRYFEIRAELTATCDPLLSISYPDGEVFRLGAHDDRWQWLQAQRAEAQEPDEASADPAAPGTVEPIQGPGHWQRVRTERWPGQLEFLRARDHRCSKADRYERNYVTGYDETGRVTVWAEIPQELDRGELTIRVYEIIDVDAEAEARERARKAERKRARVERRVHEPRPPRPAPKTEKPPPAEAEGATWSPGYWTYRPGAGKWVWVRGHWKPPATTPPAKTEDHGAPPVAGCTWQPGYWVWMQGPGRWDWVPGHWNAPPPKVEDRGEPPVPESPWIPGRWIATADSFKWIAGYWGRPAPRDETIPPPPYDGATWHAGTWLKIKGEWVWSPGFYEGSRRPPPARKSETPGPRPHADAVWLRGFWRWSQQHNDYRWIAGHWELPPGEGYVWVPDPPDPQTGFSIGGHWELRLEVDAQ